MFTNLFHKSVTQQSVSDAKTKEVWNPLLKATVSVDDTLVPLVTALWAQKYDVMHCSRDTGTDRITVGFASIGCASQFLSVVAFFGTGSTDWQLLDSILLGADGWSCTTHVRLIALSPAYVLQDKPIPPIYINIMVRFPGQRLDYVLQAIEASKAGKGAYQ